MTLGAVLALVLLQDLKPNTKTGDAVVVEITSIVEIEVKASDREGPKPDETSRTVLREDYTEAVVDARDGRATRLKLTCGHSTTEMSGTKMALTGQVPTAREGQSFEVLTGDGKYEIKREDGGPVPDGSGHVGRWEDFADLLKDASGASWKIPASKLSLLQIGGETHKLDGQLSCKNEGVNGGIATISFTGSELVGDVGKNEKLTVDVKGKLLFDTKAGRPTQLSVEGSFAYDKTFKQTQAGSENTTWEVDTGKISVHSKEWSVDVKFKNP